MRKPTGLFSLNAIIVTACAVCIAWSGWALLRVPWIRNSLVGIPTHRYALPYNIERQRLAPRSLFLAACVLPAFGAVMLTRRRFRDIALSELDLRAAAVLLFVEIQAIIAISGALDLTLYYRSEYSRLPWNVDHDQVLSHIAGRAYADAKALQAKMPPDSRVGLRTDLVDPYIMPALAFPIRFFDMYPRNPDNWRSESYFAMLAKREGLAYILNYDLTDPEDPLKLLPLEFGEAK